MSLILVEEAMLNRRELRKKKSRDVTTNKNSGKALSTKEQKELEWREHNYNSKKNE